MLQGRKGEADENGRMMVRMRAAHDNLERLVGRVYRRLVMVRLVEGL
jgi:hypothetical protein